MHFFLPQKYYVHIFLSQKRFSRFLVAKTICALRLESFWALKVAIRTVQTFWASACPLEKHAAPLRPTNQPPSPAPRKSLKLHGTCRAKVTYGPKNKR